MTTTPTNVVELESPTTTEKLRATVRSVNGLGAGVDPTGTPPAWLLTPLDGEPADASHWTDGGWDGTYNATERTAVAVSPFVVGDLGATPGRYAVWVRWTAAGETPERRAGELRIG